MTETNHAIAIKNAILSATSVSAETIRRVAEILPEDPVERRKWLADWRREYASLTTTIRSAKQDRRQGSDEQRSAAQYTCHVLSRTATDAMAVRSAYTEIVKARRLIDAA